jgi:diaminopimelate decarboxylase
VARWITEHGLTVDAVSSADLDLVRLAGIDASHVVMHCHGEIPVAVGRAAFGRFVVNSSEQVTALADNPLARTQRLVVDSTRADELAAEVVTHERLDLVGLHSRIGTTDDILLTETVVALIAKMAWIRRAQSVVMSCVSLADVDVAGCDGGLHGLRHVAKAIDQAIEDGCVRYRYPRPAVSVSLPRSALLPT